MDHNSLVTWGFNQGVFRMMLVVDVRLARGLSVGLSADPSLSERHTAVLHPLSPMHNVLVVHLDLR